MEWLDNIDRAPHAYYATSGRQLIRRRCPITQDRFERETKKKGEGRRYFILFYERGKGKEGRKKVSSESV